MACLWLMAYTYKLPLRIAERANYTDHRFIRGDRMTLWLKFFDAMGRCVEPAGEITVAGVVSGDILFQTPPHPAVKNPDGYYPIKLDLSDPRLLDSSATSAEIYVRLETEDQYRTIIFPAKLGSLVGIYIRPEWILTLHDDLHDFVHEQWGSLFN